MMDWLQGILHSEITYVVCIFIVVALIGFLSLFHRLIKIADKDSFVCEFRENFIRYCNGKGEDRQVYNWLTRKSFRMQSDMGAYGIMDYSPPGAGYMYRNYQIVVNLLTEIRKYIDLNNESLGTMYYSPTIDGCVKILDESLLRYMGVLEERKIEAIKNLNNPFVWIRVGAEQVISLPMILLVLLGVMAGSTLQKLQSSQMFKIIGASAVIVGLISGVMTIALGWDEFSSKVMNIFQESQTIGNQK